jgi:hypothetical protein
MTAPEEKTFFFAQPESPGYDETNFGPFFSNKSSQ